MAQFRKTNTPGVYVRHKLQCPAAESTSARCRCNPSYRGHRWDSGSGKMVWSPSLNARAEALNWLAAQDTGQQAMSQAAAAAPTFAELAAQWLDGVHSGVIARRRGRKGVAYSPTTFAGYERSLRYVLLPEFGSRPASTIDDAEWQSWVDRLSREGLSRSRIANHLAVARAIYGWASRPTRRLVPRNAPAGIELPPNDEKPRTRVAGAEEAAELLGALDPADRVAYGLAFYAGLRRAEIRRLDWQDVELNGYRLRVVKSKSQAGTGRRPPIAEPLRPILLNEYMRQGRPAEGPVVSVSVISNKLGDRTRRAWGWTRGEDDEWIPSSSSSPQLEPITLHECRHTYASFLMAAGYTLKELMEYMGHNSLQAAERYIKLLPRPDEADPADRLNAYLRRRTRAE